MELIQEVFVFWLQYLFKLRNVLTFLQLHLISLSLLSPLGFTPVVLVESPSSFLRFVAHAFPLPGALQFPLPSLFLVLFSLSFTCTLISLDQARGPFVYNLKASCTSIIPLITFYCNSLLSISLNDFNRVFVGKDQSVVSKHKIYMF